MGTRIVHVINLKDLKPDISGQLFPHKYTKACENVRPLNQTHYDKICHNLNFFQMLSLHRKNSRVKFIQFEKSFSSKKDNIWSR